MRLRISLRSSLILTTVCALACAFVLPAIVERGRIQRLSGKGVQIYTEPRGQYFLRQFAGDYLSERVVHVHLDDPQIDDVWLEKLHQFPYIETLSIKSPQITNKGLAILENLPNLMSLDLIDTNTTSAGIAKLRQTSAKLARVSAYRSQP